MTTSGIEENDPSHPTKGGNSERFADVHYSEPSAPPVVSTSLSATGALPFFVAR
jgi:hypothetical protein